MLHYAQTLKEIGQIYYEAQETQGDIESYQERIQSAIEMTNSIKKELVNARQRLDYEGFEVELSVLKRYLSILGSEIDLGDREIARLARDSELVPATSGRSLTEHLESLFQEIKLDLISRTPGNIVVSGFSFPDGRVAEILDLLDKTAEAALHGTPGFTVLERERLDAVLKEQELSLSDLMETTQAIAVGNALSADYILTGTVIEMRGSVTTFSRVINVETTSIESVSQVVIPKDEQISGLLGVSRNLIDFAERNQPEALEKALNDGADVNITDQGGNSALSVAILYGHTDVVRVLVEAGAELNAVTNGYTPLLLATRYKSSGIVRILLGAGADPEAVCEGKTALMMASINGDVEAVQMLLEAGAGIDARESEQQPTSLMFAVEYGQKDVVRALIDAGTDVKATANGLSVLMRAIDPVNTDHASLDVVRMLIDAGVDVNRPDAEGFTPLIRAAVSGNVEIVKALLKAGADVSAQDTKERTALMWAEQKGKTEVAALLRKAEEQQSPKDRPE